MKSISDMNLAEVTLSILGAAVNIPDGMYSRAQYLAKEELRALLDASDECKCKRYGKDNPHWPCPIHSKPAAQPQVEVERLRSCLGTEVAAGDSWKREAEDLRAQLAERDALLSDLDDAWNSHDGRGRFGVLMRKVESLSTSTEPKRRGETEPVAQSTSSDQYKAELYDEVWQKARDMGFANVTDALAKLEAQVAVVLPDRMKESRAYGEDLGGNYNEGVADGYNAALDDTAFLNTIKP